MLDLLALTLMAVIVILLARTSLPAQEA